MSENTTPLSMQRIIDQFGWADSLRVVVSATMALARHVDARLTALEAKPQAPDYWRKWAAAEVEIKTAELDAARAERDNLAAERERLAAKLDDLRRDRDNLRIVLGATDAEVKRMTAKRNALAAQVDGLRKHNASQQDLLVSGRLRSLRRTEALLAVEWVTGECPWCGNSHREGHDENCQRQAALR